MNPDPAMYPTWLEWAKALMSVFDRKKDLEPDVQAIKDVLTYVPKVVVLEGGLVTNTPAVYIVEPLPVREFDWRDFFVAEFFGIAQNVSGAARTLEVTMQALNGTDDLGTARIVLEVDNDIGLPFWGRLILQQHGDNHHLEFRGMGYGAIGPSTPAIPTDWHLEIAEAAADAQVDSRLEIGAVTSGTNCNASIQFLTLTRHKARRLGP